mgnify:FL=1
MVQANIIVYGADWCSDCRRAKQFMDEHNIQFEWIDIEVNEEARETVKKINNGRRIIPTIIFQDGSVLVEPSNTALGRKLGVIG